jgi:hypothetical protein
VRKIDWLSQFIKKAIGLFANSKIKCIFAATKFLITLKVAATL